MILAAAALTHVIEKGGVIIDALLAAGVLALPARADRRIRPGLLAAALVLTPVLLAVALWHNSKLAPLHHHPLEGVGALIGALLVIGALALILRRRPALLPLLVIAALPFRIPLGSVSNGLLIPLYAVIAAASLLHIARRWSTGARELSEEARESGLPELLLAASLVLYALQASYSTDPTKALEQVAFFYVPFALLFWLLRRLEWDAALLRRCLVLIASLAVAFVLVGFGEYARHGLLLNKGLDADAYFVRINSLFYDPNIYGRFLALTMVLLVAAMLYERRRRPIVLAGVALALMWGGLLASLSQSSMVALLAGLAIAALGAWGRRALAAMALLAVLAAGALAVFALRTHNSAGDLTSGRSSLVTGGLDLFKARPLAGYGSGSFSTEYTRHLSRKPNGFERHEQLPVELPVTTDSHTTPITIAAEQGAIGLALYVALLIACFARLLRGGALAGAGRGGGAARVAVAAAFTALVVHTLLYADFLEDPTTWVLLAVGIALSPRRAPPIPTPTAPT